MHQQFLMFLVLVCFHCCLFVRSGTLFRCIWRRGWLSTSVFLPGEFHGQRSLVGYSLCGCKDLDTTEQLTLPLFRYISLWCNMKKNVVNIYTTQYSVNTILPSQSISPLPMMCIYFKFQQCNHYQKAERFRTKKNIKEHLSIYVSSNSSIIVLFKRKPDFERDWKRQVYPNVCRSTVYNSQDTEAT